MIESEGTPTPEWKPQTFQTSLPPDNLTELVEIIKAISNSNTTSVKIGVRLGQDSIDITATWYHSSARQEQK